ncbi:Peptide methionine sulfoxide reductase A5 [Cocos nucifera]|uniref:peptide-methionine (S)-S-oxide reductase n=1 Tax=Cocos nucifera TaxID=13894 RepID=A0A8K0IJQ7_COCNU|nr:Peptide methionine sulfoxide reductase A5 [Cocos nucifera]
MELPSGNLFLLGFLVLFAALPDPAAAIRFPDRIPESGRRQPNQPLRVAVFALGSFWRSEAVFGCHPGVFRTSVGYAGGSKTNPEYRNLGDHAECVQGIENNVRWLLKIVPTDSFFRIDGIYSDNLENNASLDANSSKKPSSTYFLFSFGNIVQVEYDPKLIQFKQLLDVFWASHDPRQVFGQGPDVGNQYRSIIFTNGTLEARLAAASKEREQTKSRSSIVTTQIQQLGTFYPAVTEHQKFELKHNPFLLQLTGNMPEEELLTSSLAAKLNGYAAELCPPGIQKKIDAKINEILKNGWPIFREV